MSKFCRYCGKPLTENAKFCTKCGKSVEAVQSAGGTGVRRKILVTGNVSGTSESFYLIEFFRNAARKSNVPTMVYLVLNVIIISLIVIGLFQLPIWLGALAGIVLYLISLAIALSPVGEWMLRNQTKCKEITDVAEKSRLEPLFQEVYQKARSKDPSIPNDVKLYMSDEKSPNAFATGRKTVCVTKGLLGLPDNEIKATLGHEFGHLAHHDTDMILVVSVGNMIISAMVFIIRILVYISEISAHIICAVAGGEGGFFGSLMISLSRMMFDVFVMGAMWVWTKLGVLLVMKSSRDNEFEADQFSAELGYGYYLCSMLDMICGNQSHMKGLFANLASSHPDKASRIARLRSIGVKY